MDNFNYETQKALLKGLTEPSTFVKAYNGVVDELNELGRRYGIAIDNCIRIERGKHGVAFRITEGIKAAGVEAGNLVNQIFIAMNKNHLLPLEFVFVENEANEVYKFVNENVIIIGEPLSAGPRIMKTWLNKVPISLPYYQTLEDLTNYDEGFRELRRTNSKWADTISIPQNVLQTKDFVIATGEGDENGLNALLLMHSITGDRQRKHFTGVHHIELPLPGFIHDFKVIAGPDKNGVYIATFKIEKDNGRIISKKDASTMFPVSWSSQQFYFECYNAIQRRESVNGSSTHFMATTESGIPVEMYFSPQGKFRTIFPIYSPD